MVNIEIFLVRHGQTEANWRKQRENDGSSSWTRKVPGDPGLTLTGIMQTEKTAELIKDSLNPDLVCCSNLFSDIETALLTFPKSKIHVVPFLKEKNNIGDVKITEGPSENKPFATLTQQLQMRCHDPSYLERLIFHNEHLMNGECEYTERALKENGDIKKCFLEVIFDLIKTYPSSSTRTKSVAIICHSGILKDFLFRFSSNLTNQDMVPIHQNQTKVKPTNNLIIKFNENPMSLETLKSLLNGKGNEKPQSIIFFQGWHNRHHPPVLKQCEWFAKGLKKQGVFYKLKDTTIQQSLSENLVPRFKAPITKLLPSSFQQKTATQPFAQLVREPLQQQQPILPSVVSSKILQDTLPSVTTTLPIPRKSQQTLKIQLLKEKTVLQQISKVIDQTQNYQKDQEYFCSRRYSIEQLKNKSIECRTPYLFVFITPIKKLETLQKNILDLNQLKIDISNVATNLESGLKTFFQNILKLKGSQTSLALGRKTREKQQQIKNLEKTVKNLGDTLFFKMQVLNKFSGTVPSIEQTINQIIEFLKKTLRNPTDFTTEKTDQKRKEFRQTQQAVKTKLDEIVKAIDNEIQNITSQINDTKDLSKDIPKIIGNNYQLLYIIDKDKTLYQSKQSNPENAYALIYKKLTEQIPSQYQQGKGEISQNPILSPPALIQMLGVSPSTSSSPPLKKKGYIKGKRPMKEAVIQSQE